MDYYTDPIREARLQQIRMGNMPQVQHALTPQVPVAAPAHGQGMIPGLGGMATGMLGATALHGITNAVLGGALKAGSLVPGPIGVASRVGGYALPFLSNVLGFTGGSHIGEQTGVNQFIDQSPMAAAGMAAVPLTMLAMRGRGKMPVMPGRVPAASGLGDEIAQVAQQAAAHGPHGVPLHPQVDAMPGTAAFYARPAAPEVHPIGRAFGRLGYPAHPEGMQNVAFGRSGIPYHPDVANMPGDASYFASPPGRAFGRRGVPLHPEGPQGVAFEGGGIPWRDTTPDLPDGADFYRMPRLSEPTPARVAVKKKRQ